MPLKEHGAALEHARDPPYHTLKSTNSITQNEGEGEEKQTISEMLAIK